MSAESGDDSPTALPSGADIGLRGEEADGKRSITVPSWSFQPREDSKDL